jgi:HEAT repeat protein
MLWWTLQQLKAKEPEKRRRAVESLGHAGLSSVIDIFRDVLKDPDPAVRKQAVSVLSKHKDMEALPLLRGALGDAHESVREAAVQGIGLLISPQTTDLLVGALRDKSSAVRYRAARFLDGQGWQPATESLQAQYWVATGEYTKASALGEAAVDALIAMLQDDISYKRQAAVEALSKIEDARVVHPLLSALKDEDRNVRSAAIDGLASMGDTRAVEPLARLLKSSDLSLKARAAEALGKLGESAVIPQISLLLQDGNWEVRNAAINALGRLKAVEHLDALGATLKDADREIREAGIKALGQLGDAKAIAYLVPALIDDQESVRKNAAAVLVKLDRHWGQTPAARQVIPVLRNALKHKEYRIRQAAADVLEKLGEIQRTSDRDEINTTPLLQRRRREAREILCQMLGDYDRDLRLAAAEGLGRLGDPQGAEALAVMLTDSDHWVCRAAAKSLKELRWQPQEKLKGRYSELLAR